jgi:hypothetical protein
MLTVVYLSILQHNLVFCLPHGTFADSFSAGVVTRDKVNWLAADLTACAVRQQILILAATINCTLVLSQSLLRVT